MEVVVGEQEGLVRKVTVTVPQAWLNRRHLDGLKRIQKRVRIKGFRPGKSPMRLVEAEHGSSVWMDTLQAASQAAVQAALQQEELKDCAHVGGFRVTSGGRPGQPLTVELDAEYFEELTITEIDVAVPLRRTQVTEEEVDKAIEALRDESASLEVVEEDRGIEDGDVATITYHGRGSELAAKVHAHDQDVEVGQADTLASLTELLRGRKTGEEFEGELTFPEDFGHAELAGQTVELEVKVERISRKAVPELDDEFARDTGKADTFEALRAVVRTELEEEQTEASRAKSRKLAVAALVEKHPIAIPPGFVRERAAEEVDRRWEQMKAYGIDMATLGVPKEASIEEILPEVEGSIREGRVLLAVADGFDLQVTDEDFEQEVARIAERYNMPAARVRADILKGDAERGIRGNLRLAKAEQLVLDKAVIHEVDEWPAGAEDEGETSDEG